MEKKDIINIIGTIKAIFPYAYRDMGETIMQITIDTWYELLKDYSSELCMTAFRDVLKISKNPPVPADLVEQIEKIQMANCNANELWNEIESAVAKISRLYAFGGGKFVSTNGEIIVPDIKADEIFNGLSDIVKEWAGNRQTLRSLANYETLEFEKARFLKELPVITNRIKIKAQYNLIDTSTPKLLKNM